MEKCIDNYFILQKKGGGGIERCVFQYSSCCSLGVLQVEPFASLAGAVRSSVPRLLINRDLVGPFAWRRRPSDVVQLGDVVSGTQELVDAIGWRQEIDLLMAPVSAEFIPVLRPEGLQLMCVLFLISRLQRRQKSERLRASNWKFDVTLCNNVPTLYHRFICALISRVLM